MTDLLVLGDDGQVHVVDAGTGRRVTLSDRRPSRTNHQPVWSPDGTRVAWTVTDGRGADDLDDEPRLVVAWADGSNRIELPLTFPVFYLAWRPDGEAIATLSNGPLGLELIVTEVESGEAEIVLRGQPLFFDWAADGTLCAHVGPPGADELLVFEPGEPDRPLGPSPAMFTAPQWTREGDEVVVAQRMRDAETDWLRIVAVDRAGAVRPLTAGVEYARFCLSPDGRRLAHVGARRHVLMVRDLSTRDDEELSIDRPILFEWSADGSALLALEGGLLGTTPLVRYRVWSEHAAETYAWHYPSQVTGRQILPFAEQYVRSRTAWAPDGMAFAYAGASTDGDAGIWVQHRTRAQPELVCGGWTVSWRPSPAVTPDR